ncbi:hypothetical protein SSX86_030373, partial [Deinandra increscens subsp. villosa]
MAISQMDREEYFTENTLPIVRSSPRFSNVISLDSPDVSQVIKPTKDKQDSFDVSQVIKPAKDKQVRRSARISNVISLDSPDVSQVIKTAKDKQGPPLPNLPSVSPSLPSGFGQLLTFKCDGISSTIGHYVVQKFNPKRMVIKVNNHDVKVDSVSINKILGVPMGSHSFLSGKRSKRRNPAIVEWRKRYPDKDVALTHLVDQIMDSHDEDSFNFRNSTSPSPKQSPTHQFGPKQKDDLEDDDVDNDSSSSATADDLDIEGQDQSENTESLDDDDETDEKNQYLDDNVYESEDVTNDGHVSALSHPHENEGEPPHENDNDSVHEEDNDSQHDDSTGITTSTSTAIIPIVDLGCPQIKTSSDLYPYVIAEQPEGNIVKCLDAKPITSVHSLDGVLKKLNSTRITPQGQTPLEGTVLPAGTTMEQFTQDPKGGEQTMGNNNERHSSHTTQHHEEDSPDNKEHPQWLDQWTLYDSDIADASGLDTFVNNMDRHVSFNNLTSDLKGVDMVFFPVEEADLYYLIVFELKYPAISVIDTMCQNKPLIQLIDHGCYQENDFCLQD